MTSFEIFVIILLVINAFVLLLNYNSGRGSFGKGYITGFKDGVNETLNEIKGMFNEFKMSRTKDTSKDEGNQ